MNHSITKFRIEPIILELITVVIFSRNRQTELVKSLTYWSQIGTKCLILDNSQQSLVELPSAYRNSYFHCPNLSFAQRSGIASNLIKTKYSIICSDDERYLPEALNIMVQKIEEDLTLSSVGAHAIAVSEYGPITTATPVYQQMLGYRNFKGHPDMRLNFHFGGQNIKVAAMYRILKTDLMRDLLKVFENLHEISTPYIFELTSEILISCHGNSEYLNLLFWIRNWQNPAIDKKDWDRKLTFSAWWLNDKYKIEKDYWIELVIKEANLGLSKDTFTNIIDLYITRYPKSQIGKRSKLPLSNLIKYYVRRNLMPNTLPRNLEHSLANLSTLKFSKSEVSEAIQSMIKS
jgi:glycosyltransferase domain-containing protein